MCRWRFSWPTGSGVFMPSRRRVPGRPSEGLSGTAGLLDSQKGSTSCNACYNAHSGAGDRAAIRGGNFDAQDDFEPCWSHLAAAGFCRRIGPWRAVVHRAGQCRWVAWWLAWRRLGLLLGRTAVCLLLRLPGVFLLPLPVLLPVSGLHLRLPISLYISLHLSLCGAGIPAAAAPGRGPERPAATAELVLLRQPARLLPLCAELRLGLARCSGTAIRNAELGTRLCEFDRRRSSDRRRFAFDGGMGITGILTPGAGFSEKIA